MSMARYFVFARGDDWIVTLDGATIGQHRSCQEALNSAIVMASLMGAMHHEADVMVEADGRLDLAWTYSADRQPTETGEAA